MGTALIRSRTATLMGGCSVYWMGLLFGLQHGNCFAYLIQYSRKAGIPAGGLHIVVRLHIDPYIGRNTRGRLDFQGVFGRYGPFPVQDFVEDSRGNRYDLGEFLLGYATGLQFILDHFAGMYGG